jgi:hypothetical protein
MIAGHRRRISPWMTHDLRRVPGGGHRAGVGVGLACRWRVSTGRGWGWCASGSWSLGENRTGVVQLVLGSGGWPRLSSRAGRRGGARVGTGRRQEKARVGTGRRRERRLEAWGERGRWGVGRARSGLAFLSHDCAWGHPPPPLPIPRVKSATAPIQRVKGNAGQLTRAPAATRESTPALLGKRRCRLPCAGRP